MNSSKKIWCNAALSEEAMQLLTGNLKANHSLVTSQLTTSNLHSAGRDPAMTDAEIAFGQPDPRQIIDQPSVKWVHLTSAGYTRYDSDEFRAAMKSRGGILTNSSTVYDKPCAQHALAFILAVSRQLPAALDDQRTSRAWPSTPIRADSFLLNGQSILIYGFGAIARELVKYLKPLDMQITGVRRKAVGDEGVFIVTPEQADALLPKVDHVMNVLPASTSTQQFFNANRIAHIAPHAWFYNIGRGTTVDHAALQQALESHKLAGAYLDVTDPEPLPPGHPLWRLPNCHITPHAAGGFNDESIHLVRHFQQNLVRHDKGEPMVDRIA